MWFNSIGSDQSNFVLSHSPGPGLLHACQEAKSNGKARFVLDEEPFSGNCLMLVASGTGLVCYLEQTNPPAFCIAIALDTQCEELVYRRFHAVIGFLYSTDDFLEFPAPSIQQSPTLPWCMYFCSTFETESQRNICKDIAVDVAFAWQQVQVQG